MNRLQGNIAKNTLWKVKEQVTSCRKREQLRAENKENSQHEKEKS